MSVSAFLSRLVCPGVSVPACLSRLVCPGLSILPSSTLSREKLDCVIVPRRAFADVACYRCDPMGAKPTTSRPSLPAQFLLLPVALFALAACATPGAPGGTAEDKPLYPGPQSNVASLSEVITAHPDDPQAYNM